MSDSADSILSFLQAMRAELNSKLDSKLDSIIESQRTAELRASNRDNGLNALRRDQLDASSLATDQQDQLEWIKARLAHLEEVVGTEPPAPPPLREAGE